MAYLTRVNEISEPTVKHMPHQIRCPATNRNSRAFVKGIRLDKRSRKKVLAEPAVLADFGLLAG